MRPAFSRCCLAFLLAALPVLSSRGALAASLMLGGGARSSWIPYPAVSPSFLKSLQLLMRKPGAAGLITKEPSLSTLQNLDPGSELHRQAVGALLAHLPSDFAARLEAGADQPLLALEVAAAQQAAALEVAVLVQARTDEIAASVVAQVIGVEELAAAGKELRQFSLYGWPVKKNAQFIEDMAKAANFTQAIRSARQLALRLLEERGGGLEVPIDGALSLTGSGLRRGLPASREKVAEKLSSVPLLRDMVLELLDDSAVPPHLKRLVVTALVTKDATVIRLTDSVRRAFGIVPELNAVQISKNAPFRVFSAAPAGESTTAVSLNGDIVHGHPRSLEKTFNETVGAAANKAAVLGPHTVLVQQRPLTGSSNDFIALLHELSHVRFDHFLAGNIESLARRLPATLVRKGGDGIYEINKQLYDFLSERYAFQIEFETLKATHGAYYPAWYSRYDGMSEENYRGSISATILAGYNITDPEVVALKDLSILSILVGRGGEQRPPTLVEVRPAAKRAAQDEALHPFLFLSVKTALPGAIAYLVSGVMRNHGSINWFTLHSSNFLLGIGFLLTTHGLLSGLWEKHPRLPLLITAALGILANAASELAPWCSRVDWADFLSGLAAVAVYAFVAPLLERRYEAKRAARRAD